MKRPQEVARGAVSAIREGLVALAGQSERTLMLGTILLASSASAVTIFVLNQYFSIDALSSLIFVPDDCTFDWGVKVGRHCFSDYVLPSTFGALPNPWASHVVDLPDNSSRELGLSNYPAAAMLPQMTFGLLGGWLHAPGIGLFAYLFALTIAVLSPALWAAGGARGLERVVIFFACGMAAVPAWMAVDRGNSAGFLAPIALVFLLALSRRRWGVVAIAVILAGLVKPQFAVLGFALVVGRQWRLSGITLIAIAVTNIAAYLLWPQDFPRTILQSLHNTAGYGSFKALIGLNVSFGKGLLTIPDALEARSAGGAVPVGFLAGPRAFIGYGILLLIIGALLILGKRISPVMAGIVLLATAALFPAVALPYYLVFALPIAAVVVRDPDGSPGTGVFDRCEAIGGHRRAVGVCVSIATAFSIAHIAIPGPSIRAEMPEILQPDGVQRAVVTTTAGFASLLWLVACGVIIASYARLPACSPGGDADLSAGYGIEPGENDAPAHVSKS
ncbi:glycosyltransferase family 87 protein [Mycobacterium kubicae]|uniref:glycosyltransferase family 87 protein n=1 Tax=Mycobacterium kubicae TaxID=120959 RepID=UPI0010426F18|nr:glycosyltransferase family 87 protein [Mycobacterium kubicae]